MLTIKKVGLIWANPYSPNLGVSALTYAALLIFEGIAKQRNLKFEYLLWGAEKSDVSIKLSDNQIVNVQTRPAFWGGDIVRIIKNLIRRPWVMWHYRYLLNLKNQDFLADLGEGDSYADIYGIERFRAFDYVKRKFNRAKPYILLPQTIGPFNSDEAKRNAKISLSCSTAVIARDEQSYDYCKTLEPQTNLYRSIDMAFFLPYEKKVIPSNGKIRIGVNISGLLWEGGYTQNNQFGLKDDYQQVIYEILDFIHSQPEYEVYLIGHVVSQTASKSVEIDEDTHVLKKVKEKYPAFILAPSFKTPIEAKSYISTMDFFAGARMHACIAAISSGVPVLPMSYSRKFNGLFQDTLGYNLMVDLKEQNRGEVLSKFKEGLKNRQKIQHQIARIQANIIDPEKEKMIHLISSLIK